jgi:hypothetical protein
VGVFTTVGDNEYVIVGLFDGDIDGELLTDRVLVLIALLVIVTDIFELDDGFKLLVIVVVPVDDLELVVEDVNVTETVDVFELLVEPVIVADFVLVFEGKELAEKVFVAVSRLELVGEYVLLEVNGPRFEFVFVIVLDTVILFERELVLLFAAVEEIELVVDGDVVPVGVFVLIIVVVTVFVEPTVCVIFIDPVLVTDAVDVLLPKGDRVVVRDITIDFVGFIDCVLVLELFTVTVFVGLVVVVLELAIVFVPLDEPVLVLVLVIEDVLVLVFIIDPDVLGVLE